jgi:hypothetical protein
VTDDQNVAVSCPANTLAFGASMTCTGTGTAVGGEYENTATATGVASGVTVQHSDASHYFGEDAAVDIEKLVNGVDADAPTGPMVGVGGPVDWTYAVTNTGNGGLTSIVVHDLDGVGVTCPSSTLAVGASMTCTGAGTAQSGQYSNVANVVGFTAAGRRVLDVDPSTTTAPPGPSTWRRAPTATRPTPRPARRFASGTR